jgi:hypothetical protein
MSVQEEVEVIECDRCRGEGYFYLPNESRFAEHPIVEVPCGTCEGRGSLVVDHAQLGLW